MWGRKSKPSSIQPTHASADQLDGNSDGGAVKKADFTVTSTPTPSLVATNCVYVSPDCTLLDDNKLENFVEIGEYVFRLVSNKQVPQDSIALNVIQRRACGLSTHVPTTVSSYFPPSQNFSCYSLSLEVGLINKRAAARTVDAEQLSSHVKQVFRSQVFTVGQQFVTEFTGGNLLLTVSNISVINDEALSAAEHTDSADTSEGGEHQLYISQRRGMITDETQLNITRPSDSRLSLTNTASKSTTLFKPSFNFEQLGIGGLDSQFNAIFRRAFASRVYPPRLIKKLGIQHVKGILLHGPPGTGKTLMARQIGKMLNSREPKIVNGPEVLDKYVGSAEKRIRELFQDAQDDYDARGDEADLHLVIFDELDAICKQRGSVQGGTGVNDTVVNQLLSMMDGVHSLNNVIVVGMTNRKDLIDDALLRPGRFEVQMEVGLPDHKGRLQILQIHTHSMRENQLLDSSVKMVELAERTKNYSGAEIEGLVKCASSFALNRKVDAKHLTNPSEDDVVVTMEDFERALEEVKPAFGVKSDEMEGFLSGGLIGYGSGFDRLQNTLQAFVRQVEESSRTNVLSVLLHGPRGSGKTALAAHTALESGFPFVKIVTPETMVGGGEQSKVSRITKAFEDAYRSPLSVLVLDNIERLIEYIDIGPRFSNNVLQTLLVLLNKRPPQGRKLLVIGTTSAASVLQHVEVVDTFNVSLRVPNLSNPEDTRPVLASLDAFGEDQHLEDALEALPAKVPIKQLLMVTEMARSQGDGEAVQPDHFRQCLLDCGL
eukprot:gb/GECH01012851.1/.p1 GENE.gb/GECH01012851.1/~~gb/GECH01012851.1/.p1  ORF type:complete len:771 (+),score=155.62 gb/GECH01012851.1/:1-2313(+)